MKPVQKHFMLSQSAQTPSARVARLIQRGLSMMVIMTGLVAFPLSAHAKDKGAAHQAAGTHLQKAGGTLRKCLSALDKLESNAKVEKILRDLELKAQQGMLETLNAPAMLAEIKKATGKPVDLTAEELKVCVAVYHAQMSAAPSPATQLKSEGGNGYPNCAGACPNPTSYGGICCGSATCTSSCGPEGGNCVPQCLSTCFPGDATVRLEGGGTKAMHDLALGDRVQAVRADGSIAYEEVYLMTHQEAVETWPYLKLALSSGKTLTLSPRHFIPTAQGGETSWEARRLLGANEVKVGETIWYQDETGARALSVVTEVTPVAGVGAFNPLTASGTIVVDGVVASAHSDWFLDGIVSAHMQEKVYQSIMSPVRGIYGLIGPKRMHVVTHEWHVVDFIRENGLISLLLLLTLFAALLAGVRALWRRQRKPKPVDTAVPAGVCATATATQGV